MTLQQHGYVCAERCCIGIRDPELRPRMSMPRAVFERPMYEVAEFVNTERCECDDAASSTDWDMVAWAIRDTEGEIVFESLVPEAANRRTLDQIMLRDLSGNVVVIAQELESLQ